MILPHTNGLILLLMAASMFCLGSWAGTFKFAGKRRFELYYFDFALGLLLCAAVLALTVGNLGFDGFGFIDSVMNAGKREWMYAVAAGVVFNIGNLMLVASVAAAGLAVAFPVALGTALILNAILNWASNPSGNALFLWTGCALVAGAIVASAIGYGARPAGRKGFAPALAGGLLLGGAQQLLQKATVADIGLGPYAVWVFFGVAVAITTLATGMFLLNLSVQGEELSIVDYFGSTPAQHLLGLAGGGLWALGAVAGSVAAYANAAPGVNGGLPPGATPVSPVPIYALAQAAAVLAAIWGLLVWKEGKGGNLRAKAMTALTLALFAAGVACIALSPVAGGAK